MSTAKVIGPSYFVFIFNLIMCECNNKKFHEDEKAVFFGTRQRLSQFDRSQEIDVAGTHIQFKNAVRLLGVKLDCVSTNMSPTSYASVTIT